MFARGTFNVGSAGMGFVCINPFLCARKTSSGDIAKGIRFSTGGYGGSTIEIDSTVVGIGTAETNSDYTEAGTLGVSYRVVSCGLRVSYAGSELNRAGTMTGIETPDHGNLHGSTEASLLQFDHSRLDPTTRAWHTVVYSPKFPLELTYMPTSFVPDVTVQTAKAPMGFNLAGNPFCMGFIVSGTPANTAYKFEVALNCEFIGELVRGKSDSKADPIGYSAARDAVPQGPFIGPPGQQILKSLKDASVDLAEMVGSYVGSNEGRRQITQAAGQLYTMYKGLRTNRQLEL